MILRAKTSVHPIYEINFLQYGILKKALSNQIKNADGSLLKMKYKEGNYYISIHTKNNDYAIYLGILSKYLDLFNLSLLDKNIKT